MGVDLDHPARAREIRGGLEGIAPALQIQANPVSDGAWPLSRWAMDGTAPLAE